MYRYIYVSFQTKYYVLVVDIAVYNIVGLSISLLAAQTLWYL